MAAGFSATKTAERINCHRSTDYRELNRCPGRDHGARRTQKASDLRQTCAYKHTKFNDELWARISRNVERQLSPEMIACRMPLECISDGVSTSTLYRRLRWDYQQGGTVHQHLQRALKPYKRAYGFKRWPNRYEANRSIHDRPKSADSRRRLGDWEGGTMYGKQGHLVRLVDRRSRLLLARRILLRTRAETAKAVISMLNEQAGCTLTLDNSVEFVDLERIEEESSTKVYFADPYASWQRGSNENANGRLRRWIPRSTDLSKLKPQTLRRIVERMNEQPRKCLGWRTPYEVHHNVSVAVIV